MYTKGFTANCLPYLVFKPKIIPISFVKDDPKRIREPMPQFAGRRSGNGAIAVTIIMVNQDANDRALKYARFKNRTMKKRAK